MTDLRSVVSDHWAALAAAPRGSAWLTSALPVDSAGSAVMCAIGPDRKRHLLVPAPDADVVRPDTRAAAVHLVNLVLESPAGTSTFADLVLLRDDLQDVFTGLCADVIGALATDATAPLVSIAHVLDEWHELFRSGRQLGIEQLAGLYGELVFLNALLDLNPDLVAAWQGPLRSPHDFVANGWAAEVKSTASSEGRAVRIHGVDQLTVPPSGSLMIRWMRLDTADGGGTSVPELVESTIERVSRPRELWQLLAAAGYLMADSEKYAGIRFTVTEDAGYLVTEEFPRIVPSSFSSGLPAGISSVRYTLDLDLAPPPMQQHEIAQFLEVMAKR